MVSDNYLTASLKNIRQKIEDRTIAVTTIALTPSLTSGWAPAEQLAKRILGILCFDFELPNGGGVTVLCVSPIPPTGRNIGDFMRKPKRGRGNIRPETTYDPFPKSGLVRQYEPFIRKYVSEFCQRYPQLQREGVLFGAVRIAGGAEKTVNRWCGLMMPIHMTTNGLKAFRHDSSWRSHLGGL